MMCSGDRDLQMGCSNSSSSEQRMMMNMPATNISSTTTTTPPPVSASSSSSPAAATKAVMTQQGPLQCPRCDSANTKFCYYNNYSLSQPRHFCKACKRYWTRGGTLRNVPAGGGCRKNKRVKKQHHHQQQQPTPPTASVSVTATNTDPLLPPPPLPTSSSDLSSLFYDLSTSDHMNMNLGSTAAAYDALGLGGLIPINTNLTDLQQQQPASSSPFVHHNNEYPSSSFTSQAASLLMSRLKQPKKAEDQYGQSLLLYDTTNLGFLKDVKLEGDHHHNNSNLNLMMTNNISTEWQAGGGGYPFEANINGATDASFLYWNLAMGVPLI